MKLKAYQVACMSILLSTLFAYQNCARAKLVITDVGSADKLNTTTGDLAVCDGISCDLSPLTSKPAVTTVLLALGDKANQQLVINGASSQLLAETIVRYSTPTLNPKILVVQDQNISGEDPEDTAYLLDVLLSRYDITYMVEPTSGLNAEILSGYDLIWFNNPGHPMTSIKTRDALIQFKGAVVLQGDDLSQGRGFHLEALTGLRSLDNGSEVTCNGQRFLHDNNLQYQYRVSLNAEKIPFPDTSLLKFKYGNDIDNTVVIDSRTEVLATAIGGDENCQDSRPAIVRHFKE